MCGWWGGGTNKSLLRSVSLGRMNPSFHLLHHLLSALTSQRVGKITGRAGIHDWEDLKVKQRVRWKIVLISGKVL